MQYTLRLYTDTLSPKSEVRLPPATRVIYVREGDAIVRSGGQTAGLASNSAWHGRDATVITAGTTGTTLLRWEIVSGRTVGELAGAASSLSLAQPVDLSDPGGYLMRCDRVDFPLGGIAYTHVHRGPGIRCLLTGGIRVEVGGAAHDVAPGEAWFEAGPDPVLALASKTALTAFARVMVLPRELKGKSSIRYVKPEDADKPKLQTYRMFVDDFIDLP